MSMEHTRLPNVPLCHSLPPDGIAVSVIVCRRRQPQCLSPDSLISKLEPPLYSVSCWTDKQRSMQRCGRFPGLSRPVFVRLQT